MANHAKGNKAWSVSDRSGRRFPYNEMVYESGTKLWVHYSESDGEYNAVEHPQGRIKMPRADAISLETVRGFQGRPDLNLILDENGEPLVFDLMFGVEEQLGY